MSKTLTVLAMSAAFMLSGCVAMATEEASRTLAERCASAGEEARIAPDEPIGQGGMFGTVTVSGKCLLPGEPGYDEAMTIEEYRATIGRKPS